MAYSQSGKVEAKDINDIVTTINTTLVSLGQSPLGNVTTGGKVLASDWATINSTITNIATHQGTVIASLPSISAGQRANYYSTLTTATSSINNYNASAQGTTVYYSTEISTGWYNYITFTQSIAFANATAATNFFNAGGQLALRMLHPATSTSIDNLFNVLATNCGTLTLSGQNSGTRTIAGTTYTGFQKVGGGGNTPTISVNAGYAGLTATKTTIFNQIGGTFNGTSGAAYNQNFIAVVAYTTNNGATINFETTWDEIPNGLVTGAGAATAGPDAVTHTRSTNYVIVKPPSTAKITNTWGTLTFAGSVAGQ